MIHTNKVSLKYISVLTVTVILFILTVQSKDKDSFYYSFHTLLTSQQDTIIPGKKNIGDKSPRPSNDTSELKVNDTSELKIVSNKDSIPKKNIDSLSKTDTTAFKITADTLRFDSSKNALDTVIEYTAEDSMVLKRPKASSAKSRAMHHSATWGHGVARRPCAVDESHQATRLAVIQLTMFGSHEPAL